jgi:DNA-binding transcriptional ArsR family regulator
VDEALRALAEPNRRRILELVAEGERSAGDIAAHFSITRPAVSQHLTVLKGAALVHERRDGTKRLYSVRTEGFESLRDFLDKFWGDGLERLKIAAEHEEGRRRRGRRPA